MHSSLVRIQNVFGFFTTVAFFVAALVALSVVIAPQNPSASLSVRDVQVARGRANYYSSRTQEYAQIKFDMKADLSSLFNWNTKQVFIWVTASWPAADSTISEAVIWDQIIPAAASKNPNLPLARRRSKTSPPTLAERGQLTLKNQKAKYQITNNKGRMASVNNATLSLHWNVQPWVGALLWRGAGGGYIAAWEDIKGGSSKAFDFPALKTSSNSKQGGTSKA